MASLHETNFADLSPEAQEEVRQKQQSSKEKRLKKKERKNLEDRIKTTDSRTIIAVNDINLDKFPARITQKEYFNACPAGICYIFVLIPIIFSLFSLQIT